MCSPSSTPPASRSRRTSPARCCRNWCGRRSDVPFSRSAGEGGAEAPDEGASAWRSSFWSREASEFFALTRLRGPHPKATAEQSSATRLRRATFSRIAGEGFLPDFMFGPPLAHAPVRGHHSSLLLDRDLFRGRGRGVRA